MKILMVCLGNICRSPLAEGILQHKANAAGLNWSVDSAGTGGWQKGEAPHELSQKIAMKYGIDISSQRARAYVEDDMLVFDHIYFMDRENYRDARQISADLWKPEKATLIMNLLYPHQNLPVPDPYNQPEKEYEHVYTLLNSACDKIIETAKQKKINP